MLITRPTLPPKAGYVEVEVNGIRTYKNVSTKKLIEEERTLEAIRKQKEYEISCACNEAIVAGVDVETSVGVEHFSLQETDQINLTSALTAVDMQGIESYPYHADGKLCRMFTKDEIMDIANTATQYKLYHITLCNHLLTWVRRAESIDEINSITYSADNLPEDLASNMTQFLSVATVSVAL